jgi:uncharacterized delta-60 repeat protein
MKSQFEAGRRQVRRGSTGSRTLATAVAAVVVLACPAAASAAGGDLDPSFSGDGIAMSGVLGDGGFSANSVAIDSRGRIVVGADDRVVRFMPNGTLDRSFAGDGEATPPFEGRIGSVTVDAQDRIILAGRAPDPRDRQLDAFAVGRLRPDGTPDSSFSGDGQVVTPIGGTQTDEARAVAIDDRGRIVAAGLSYEGKGRARRPLFALARYRPSGRPDPSFSGDGRVVTRFPDVTGAKAEAVALDSKGRIVAAGAGGARFAVARYTPGGGLDPAFSGDGTLTTPMGARSAARSVSLDDSDRIVVAGGGRRGSYFEFAVARYRPKGVLDSSFSGNGKVFTSLGPQDSLADGVVIDERQRIVAAGSIADRDKGPTEFGLARYTPSGALDPAFSADGLVTTPVGPRSGANALALDPRGKIVAAGYTSNADRSRTRIAVARYLSG